MRLEPIYRERLLLDYGDMPMAHRADSCQRFTGRRLPPSNLATDYDCIHGHFLPLKYYRSFPNARYAIWLRAPVQWALSRFNHGKRKGRFAAINLRQFIDLKRFHNPYAAYLSEFPIDRFDFIGILEHWECSIDLFGRMFDVEIPQQVQAFNVNPRKAVCQRYPVDSDLAEAIGRRNWRDIEIYNAAVARFTRIQRAYVPRSISP